MKSVWRFLKVTAALMAAALLLSSCGGGGGNGGSSDGGGSTPTPTATTLSGTAAAGGPIIGTVTVKDSTTPTAKTVTVPIKADGSYTADLTGMTPPFLVRADGAIGGTEYHLYSAATSADQDGTINITPLTDLIVANVAGAVAKAYFDGGNFSNLSAAQLNTQRDALTAKLVSVLEAVGVTGSVDLLRGSFNPNHTGLDAALDLIRISIDPSSNTATISNLVTTETISSNLATRTYTGNITGVTATAVAELPKIKQVFKSLSDLFATSAPTSEDPRLMALFDQATFLESGRNLAEFLFQITTEPQMVGARYDNIYLESIGSNSAVVTFDVLRNDKPINEGQKPWRMIKKTDGKWYLQGDQRIAFVGLQPTAEYQMATTPATFLTGLNLRVQDRGGRQISAAVFTGKGLTGPVRLTNAADPNWFVIEDPAYGQKDFYFMTDAQIAAMADSNEAYSVELFVGTTRVATYTEKVKKRPYLNSQLSAANFPAVTAPTLAQLRAFNGGTITFNWTLPAGLSSQRLAAGVNDNSGHSAQADSSLLPTDTSKSLTINATAGTPPAAFTPTSRWAWLEARDSFGRNLGTSMW
ncbi:MAG: hypothetical protein A2075_16270 [Geobacteraceae bacterium GWC2_58_44]|nr:MAG: hypothetical protein A2075_16270 [Geobacteraceae bacterium GWC2_58_44]HBG05947.1 hypothetical protein [Geobacter sp.]